MRLSRLVGNALRSLFSSMDQSILGPFCYPATELLHSLCYDEPRNLPPDRKKSAYFSPFAISFMDLF